MGLKDRFCLGRLCGIVSTSALATVASMLGMTLGSQGMEAQEAASNSSVAIPGDATDGSYGGGGQTPKPKLWTFDPTRVDFSIGVAAQLTATRTTDTNQSTATETIFTQNTSGASPSAGVLGSYHQQFRGWLGYDVNVGYTTLAEDHTITTQATPTGGTATTNFLLAATRTNLYEVSLGYVVKAPTSSHRLQTFLQGGTGMLVFQPTGKPYLGSADFRVMALFGAGGDYRISDHLGFRIEYRGLLTKTPNYIGSDGGQYATGRTFTVISEPTVSLKYTFGAHKRMQ